MQQPPPTPGLDKPMAAAAAAGAESEVICVLAGDRTSNGATRKSAGYPDGELLSHRIGTSTGSSSVTPSTLM
jgi:hypothetical protein